MLEYKQIPDSEIKSVQRIIAIGGTALREAHAPHKHKWPSRADFRGHLFGLIDAGNRRAALRLIRAENLNMVLDVRDIETKVLEGFFGEVVSQAKSWGQDDSEKVNDLIQEGTLALLDAIYYYTRPNIKFHTYASHAITNCMISVCTTDGLIRKPDNGANRSMLEAYYTTMTSTDHTATFEEVTAAMTISEDDGNTSRPLKKSEIALLRDLLIMVNDEASERETSRSSGMKVRNDYTAFSKRTPVAASGKRRAYYRGEDNDSEGDYTELEHRTLSVLIERADELDVWDQKVLKAWIDDGQDGWQTRVAAATINKMTGRPYSRMSATNAVQRLIARAQAIFTELKTGTTQKDSLVA